MTITIADTEVELLPQKAVYLPQQNMLVIADMHLGKLTHFRRKGIFVPTSGLNEDLIILQSLIIKYSPYEVVFLGDLFHSEINSEYNSFLETINRFSDVNFTLTKGNHDIIPKEFFQNTRVEIIEEKKMNGIVLRHQYPKIFAKENFYIIGHIHPGVVIQGKGRQIFRVPCFYRTKNALILPAFGKHTGLFVPESLEGDLKYIIMNEEVIQIK